MGARQEITEYFTPSYFSTIMIQYHPWAANGPGYLKLSRKEKSRILWDKIKEDATQGPINTMGFFKINLNSIFNEWGDEYDCRNKTTHGKGNVGKVEWISLKNHNYTGMFKGGDTGYIRTSVLGEVNLNPVGDEAYMIPGIALKFLRDGMDSANTVARVNSRKGQRSYNWFDSEITSLI